MKHKYELIQPKTTTDTGFETIKKCSICGLKMTISNTFGFITRNYERSGQLFIAKYEPDCLDWNDNNLD